MAINSNDLKPLIYDPARAMSRVLNEAPINNITEPTNPFIMLLEASASLAAASALESTATIKRMYPSLATDTEDLLPHVTGEEMQKVFSQPSEASIVFYINLMELKNNGVRVEELKYTETIIPDGTVINITGIPFTLLNDIRVKLYDSGTVFAEQTPSDEVAANSSLSILSSGIVNFQDNTPWIAVETLVKQVRKNVIDRAVTVAEGFELRVKHSDRYYYSNVYYRNSDTNNQWVKLLVTHNDTYIDPAAPTVSILTLDGLTEYTIPDTYLLSGSVSGEVRVELFETKGLLNLPLYKYTMAEYEVNLVTASSNPVKASISNITVYANSRDTLSGGTTGLSFKELKNSVIHNTLGHSTLPVTSEQLNLAGNLLGFEIHNLIDTVTDRVFAAARNMPRYDSPLILARPDIYFNTLTTNLANLVSSNNKVIVKPTYALIPSGTIMSEDNGIIRILTDLEVNAIDSMSKVDKTDYVNRNKLYYTPYYYLLDITDPSIISSRVYDLDTPNLRDIKITGKNVNVIERVNVGKFGLVKTPTGYDLVITVLYNDEFKSTDYGLLRGQLTLPVGNGNKAHFQGIYNTTTELMTFKIDTNFNIASDETIETLNAISSISNNYVNLSGRGEIYLYSTDTNIVDSTKQLVDEIKVEDITTTTLTVLSKEELTVEFGKPLKYLWNKMYTSYEDRPYLTYNTDKPLVYKNDVYETDPLTGSIITVTIVNGVNTVGSTLLHTEGDPVLDDNGDPIMEYHKGDVILDANGLPTLDNIGGLLRHIDVLMIEYVYLAASTNIHKNYLTVIRDTLNSWIVNDLRSINNKVLENTEVHYKSYKSATPVEVMSESVKTKIPYSVASSVVLYSTKDDYSGPELDNLRSLLGHIIHDHLDGTVINIAKLKDVVLANTEDAIVGVRINGLDGGNNSEIFTITNPMARLGLSKKLSLNSNNEHIVTYDLDLKIHKV